MNNQFDFHRAVAATGLACALALALSACGGGGDSGSVSSTAAVSASVPDSTFASSQAFMAYDLSLKPSNTTEPLLIGSHTAPTDAPAEPMAISM